MSSCARPQQTINTISRDASATEVRETRKGKGRGYAVRIGKRSKPVSCIPKIKLESSLRTRTLNIGAGKNV